MNCPVCKESMIILELNEVEIDYCSQCHGIWLDSGELEELLKDSKAKDQLLASFEIDNNVKEKPYKCPICSKRMDKVLYGENKKVLVDKCRKEHGLWFDKGELHQIVEMGSLGEDNKVLNLLNNMFTYNLKNKEA